MFGHNEIVGQKYFSQYTNTLIITTVFATLQGEGKFGGRLAVFVRTAKCNLACSWCDTYFDSGDEMSFDAIIKQIRKSIYDYYAENNLELPKNVFRNLLIVLTGGEPSLQKNIVQFLDKCHEEGFDTQIESNGIIFQDIPAKTHLCISAKCNEKTGKYIIPHKKNLERADSLKFVISKTDISYNDVPQFGIDWYNQNDSKVRNLYVSPMNMYINQPIKLASDAALEDRSEVNERISFWTPNLMDPVQNQINHEYAAFIAMKHNCNLSLQTHLYASLP